MALSPRTAAQLERTYAEWREAETRAVLERDVWRACAEAPDTHWGRLEVAYQQLRVGFSPAYFSGSRRFVGPRLLRSLAFWRQHYRELRRDIGRAVAGELARQASSSIAAAALSPAAASPP
jgi:hypothetical protein